MSKCAVLFREKRTVNTDPENRCYNGCNFSEETIWTEWELVAYYSTKDGAEESATLFKRINPSQEYKVEEARLE